MSPHPRLIIETAAEMGGTTPAELVGPRRFRDIVRARHVAVAVIRDTTSLSLPEIGRVMGGRDHTTILHSIRVVAADPDLTARADEIRARVLGQLVLR